MKKVEIYTANACPFCIKAKNLLKKKGIDYSEFRVDQNPEYAAASLLKSGGVTSVPQIFIEDVHVGGCDELYALEREKKLDAMLEDEHS